MYMAGARTHFLVERGVLQKNGWNRMGFEPTDAQFLDRVLAYCAKFYET